MEWIPIIIFGVACLGFLAVSIYALRTLAWMLFGDIIVHKMKIRAKRKDLSNE